MKRISFSLCILIFLSVLSVISSFQVLGHYSSINTIKCNIFNQIRISSIIYAQAQDNSNKNNDSQEVDQKYDMNDIISDQDTQLDADNFTESLMDESIQRAVKNLAQQTKPPDINPVEVLHSIMKDLKSRNYGSKLSSTNNQLDAKDMLAKLFPGESSKDPFDEKIVMMKLYRLMDKDDFDHVFRDPIIGTMNRYLDKLSQNAHTSFVEGHTYIPSTCKLPDISHIGIKTSLNIDREVSDDYIPNNEDSEFPYVGIDGELSKELKETAFKCATNFERKLRVFQERENNPKFVEVGKQSVDKFMNKIEERHIMESSERQKRLRETQFMIYSLKETLGIHGKNNNNNNDNNNNSSTLPNTTTILGNRKLSPIRNYPQHRKSSKAYSRLSLFKSLLEVDGVGSDSGNNISSPVLQ